MFFVLKFNRFPVTAACLSIRRVRARVSKSLPHRGQLKDGFADTGLQCQQCGVLPWRFLTSPCIPQSKGALAAADSMHGVWMGGREGGLGLYSDAIDKQHWGGVKWS